MNASNRPTVYARPFRTREARKGILQGKKVGHVWLFSQEAVAKLAGVPIDE